MKYTNKKKVIAMAALLVIAASFSGCNSANTTATIDPEVTSSEIVRSAPVSSEVVSSKETSSEAVSSAPVSSEAEKPESEAASSEAATSSAAEVSSQAEAPVTSSEPTVSSAPATVSQSAASSAPAAVSKPAATSQPVSSTATSAPPVKTVSAPTQPSGSTKAFEDMTIEEQDQWLLDQLNQQLGSMEVHDSGIVERHSIESTQPTEDDDAEHKALEQEKLEQLRQNLQGAQNEQKTEQEVSQMEEPKQSVSQTEAQEPETTQTEASETNPTEEQETVSEATGDVYEAIRLINQERVKAGLSELILDESIIEMATVRASEIVTNFDHTRNGGEKWSTIFNETGSPFKPTAENIYGGRRTAKDAVNWWMNSPGHKANILKKNLTHIGVGYYYNANSEYHHYWVMLGAN